MRLARPRRARGPIAPVSDGTTSGQIDHCGPHSETSSVTSRRSRLPTAVKSRALRTHERPHASQPVHGARLKPSFRGVREKGIPHEYLLFPDEGHGFAKPENRLRFYAAAEKFLATHLGGRFEP